MFQRVMVLDADTQAVAGDIPGTDGVHGIALAPEFGHRFTSDGRPNAVTISPTRPIDFIEEVRGSAERMSTRTLTFRRR